MRITGASIPAGGAPVPAPGGAATRPAGTSGGSPVPSASPGRPDPAVSAAVAQAEKTADKSRTARRDALSSELNRLLQVARKLNGAGDLRSSADALQDLARQIAKLARALADAERALAPADRRGVPNIALPAARAQPAAAAEDAGPEDAAPDAGAPEDATPSVSAAAAPGADRAEAETARAGPPSGDPEDDAAPPVGAPVPADEIAEAARERQDNRREDARAGRDGTRQLLLRAADELDRIRKTVRKAELFEIALDPEAAKERGKAGREIEGYAIELRGLAGGLADPARGLGLDVTA